METKSLWNLFQRAQNFLQKSYDGRIVVPIVRCERRSKARREIFQLPVT
jgi:hypothetical protein